mmetsp:Transcript_32187/g.55599  ORF Transcript_32187/g.55599 Transcript_32187/m.55599 type:complete len:437 (-) Transcript_32187:4093-5403(-)
MAEEFQRSLREFFESRGEHFRVPQIGGRDLDIYKLYHEVITRGGFQQVCNNKLWKEVVTALEIPSTCTSASYTLRQHYSKLLYAYEQEFFFGKQPQALPPTVVEPSTSNMTKNVKLPPGMMSDTRRMILAFESRFQSEVNWTLNSLLLLSCNNSSNYVIDQYGLLESFSNYLKFASDKLLIDDDVELPAKRPREVASYDEVSDIVLGDQVKSMTLILRNFSMVRSNEIPIFKCPFLLETVLLLFTGYLEKEVTQNCLELISNIASHIFLKDLSYFRELMTMLLDCLQSELAEQSIETLRKLSLPLGNEEVFEILPSVFYEHLCKWLFSHSSCRESVLEILLTMSSQKLSTRVKIARAPRCIESLVKLLSSISHTDDTEDKQSKMSALILSNLSEAPSICKLFTPFEREIFAVAAIDERVSGLLCNVLFEIQELRTK